MLITFLNNGQKFDGATIFSRALGATEKSLILLTEALASIGHVVRVFNNCEKSIVLNKVSWNPIKNIEVAHSDVWVILNDPQLLGLCKGNTKKFLWLTVSGFLLAKPEYFKEAITYKPVLIYQGESHINTIPDGLKFLDATMIPLGVHNSYTEALELNPSVTPKALVTTNPLMGLDWLIKIWVDIIHVKLPWAELHIYSNTMFNGLNRQKVTEKYKNIFDTLMESLKYNIHIKKPRIDSEFIKEIRDARVHLYPSHKFEISALTLQETQAMGIPAVIRPLGASIEKIINGKTGFVGSDDNAFAEYAIRFLSDLSYFKRTSVTAKKMQINNSWDKIAIKFEDVFKAGFSE